MNNLLARLRYGYINWTRRLRPRPRARLTRVVVLHGGRNELPTTLNPKRVYQLGNPGKWAVLTCPCGRGHLIELNLAHPDRARWTITSNGDGLPSLAPSIDFKGTRRCHFWLRNGRIRWV